MELAFDMGFPPLLATGSNYHLFFKDVKFFEHSISLEDSLLFFQNLS
jgi:hypothetical protein